MWTPPLPANKKNERNHQISCFGNTAPEKSVSDKHYTPNLNKPIDAVSSRNNVGKCLDPARDRKLEILISSGNNITFRATYAVVAIRQISRKYR